MGTSFARVLGNHAEVPVAVVEHGGRKWACWPLGEDVKTAFERWLEARAARPIAALEGVLSEAALAAALERLSDRALAGEFAFGGPGYMRAMGVDPGAQRTEPHGSTAPPKEETTEEAPGEKAATEARAPEPAPPQPFKPVPGAAGTLALAAILFRCTEWDMMCLMRDRRAEVMAALQKAMREARGPEGNS